MINIEINIINQFIIDLPMSQEITLELLESLSYTDFVGIINQWNVLPWSYTTLSERIAFGRINKESYVLDIASTTWFSLRETAYITWCSGVWIDISKYSIDAAIYNKNAYAPNLAIDYLNMDSIQYDSKSKFSHILLGASLGFFKEPSAMIKKCIWFFDSTGILLASPFFGNWKGVPSSSVLENFKKVIWITPTLVSYKEVMSLYKDFEVLYESKKIPTIETEEELKKYCEDTINSFCTRYSIQSEEIYNYAYKRLYDIRSSCNQIRPFHDYSVLVLRYRESTYPNRFVELF